MQTASGRVLEVAEEGGGGEGRGEARGREVSLEFSGHDLAQWGEKGGAEEAK